MTDQQDPGTTPPPPPSERPLDAPPPPAETSHGETSPSAPPLGQEAAEADAQQSGRPAPQYGEYAPPGSVPPPAAAQPAADATGSAAESLGGVGAFVGGSYPQVVASFTKYEDAQKAVDRLSDEGFPVENVSIVGHDLRTVENIRGRVTNGSAALRGLTSGIWFGIALGVLFALFNPKDNFFGVVLTIVVIGAVWGLIFGFVGHAMTRGQRDFSSIKTMEAGRYEVLVRGEYAARATQLLSQATYPS
ncbi:general stress protein [Frondihabitans australicus]|uniref:General stress protein 17M-like domain-containing protein n=1 Tax=Frondihabitans australicus TaxID=386892 RepID=A0A495IN04_9MICO|nr:general stress protein [Frondihabitans australicus]RKR76556.1 hypothetical protein C8E83_3733 [Frondihabitans australicus]